MSDLSYDLNKDYKSDRQILGRGGGGKGHSKQEWSSLNKSPKVRNTMKGVTSVYMD